MARRSRYLPNSRGRFERADCPPGYGDPASFDTGGSMIAVDGGRRAALVAIASLTALVGPVRGTDLDHVSIDTGVLIGASDAVVRTFKGVPYAAAPVGAQRWRPPRPALRWTQPRQATEYGPACPQFAP